MTATRSRAVGILLAAAGIWAAVLPVGAVVAPLYSGSSVTGSGGQVAQASTLVAVNGWWVLGYAFAPLVITLLVAAVLRRRGAGRGPGAVAWVAVGLLAAFTVVSLLTIGVFLLPVTGCLVAACVVRQSSASGHRPSAGGVGTA